jgi:class 3 adenylate cyclase/streptogramin lyase
MPRGDQGRRRLLTTVLFTDIVGSTERAEELGDKRWRQLLDHHHTIVRRGLKRHHGREIDTAGDGFFATFDQPSDAIDCATELIDRLHQAGIDIRAGVHMGEVEVMDSKVGGIAVHVGARIMSKAGPGQVLVSNTVRDLMAGSDLDFDDAGFHELKGVAAQMHLFSVRHAVAESEPAPVAPGEPPEPARRPRVLAVGVVAALVVVVGGLVMFLLTRGSGAADFVPAANTVAEIDPASSTVIGGAHVGTTPTDLAFDGQHTLWVANFDDKTVQSVDVVTRDPGSAKGGVLANPTGIAVGGGFVWVTNGFAGQVVKIDPRQANSVVPIPAGSGVQGLAYGFDHVWIASPNDGTLLQLDPVSQEVTPISLPDGAQPVDVATGAGSVWVADALGGRVFEVDPESRDVKQSVPLLTGQPARVAFGAGAVWVTSTDADSLTRIDPATGQTTTISNVGNGPLGVAAGAGGVWVANSLDQTVARVDPKRAKVIGVVHVPVSPDAVAVTPDGVWVSLHSL